MNVEDRLLAEGFVNHRSDEPYEDYWILETGIQPDLLVEQEESGWRICRMPAGDEPRGEWVDIASGLDQRACISAVEAFLVEGGCPRPGSSGPDRQHRCGHDARTTDRRTIC